MKPCRWLNTLLALLLIVGMHSPAVADWVQIDEPLEVTQTAPSQTTVAGVEAVKVTVRVWNNSAETDIEGKLRLIFNANVDGFPVPYSASTKGEDGNNNETPYFDLSTLQIEYFEAGEAAYVDMLFSVGALKTFFKVGEEDSLTEEQTASLGGYYLLSVKVNDASVLGEIFRKKISKTPERYSGEAIIKVMEVYVKAQSTKGQSYIRDLAGELAVCCEEGQTAEECADCSAKTDADFAMVKPLIVTYIQEEEDALFNNVPNYGPEGQRYAHDVYAAVSLDDGLTWKRRNLSRTAIKGKFVLENDVVYPGDSESQDLAVDGHYALVTWVDKFCQSGNPWNIVDADDIYQVTGSQRSKDYLDVKGDEDPRPDLGERPFSCVLAARGVLELNPESPDYGTIVWYRPEQLSVGRRDAIHNFTAVVEPLYDSNAQAVPGTGGFAVTWQEDVQGLKTGQGRGPGAGMTGASVNHKTDIWYSYIDWAKFAPIDTNFVPNDGGDDADPSGDSDGYTEYKCPTCSYVYDPAIGDEANGILPGTKFADLPEGWACPLDGAAKTDFIKVSRPHVLHTMSPPVPLTDNAVCRERTLEPVMGHVHDPAVPDCDYYYEGGTNSEPLLWEDLPDDWKCPKCGRLKSTFSEEAIHIKDRKEGAPYCNQFAGNPRIDGDGKYAIPGTDAAVVAFYTQDGDWKDANGNIQGSEPGDAIINPDGTAVIGETRVYWSGEPLDGNTGASRANLALVNHNNETLALVAYEETKGVGVGGDKEAAAMEQKAPYPLVKMTDEYGNVTWEAGATNSDCRSCHYQNVVPRDRFIPAPTVDACTLKGGTWASDRQAYYPYTGYPYLTEEPVTDADLEAAGVSTYKPGTTTEVPVPCIKYFGGRNMYPRDWEKTDPTAYYDLPDHMPGWHQEALDCSKCHLPFNTKDLDKDGVMDRVDLCLVTPADELESVDRDATSLTYGCSESQDPTAPDNNKDAVKKYRHGKNIYYHYFPFSEPATIAHGIQVNQANKYGWNEQGDVYENARRVRLVPNEAYAPENGAEVTLGLLYKEGKDGQGAPADAMLRLFRNGFAAEDMDPQPLNMSSSTPAWFKDPALVGNEDGTGDNTAGDGSSDLIGNHKTPNVEHYYWTDANLQDSSGFWKETDSGDKDWNGYTPQLQDNPFENVFSSRLAIRGNTIVTGFAHCANWSAGKKAKDHYDFYVRVSKDSGRSWTLPVNVSRLKNHEESVSDCRVILTPETIDQQYPAEPGTPADISMNGAAEVFDVGDFNNPNVLFVAVGTKENFPQLYPNEDEEDEIEIFKDVFYSKATIKGSSGGETGDLNLLFETYSKDNPLYVAGSPKYLTAAGEGTNEATDASGIPNQPNPAFPASIDEFNWMAQGDAKQGDVQFGSNPFGTKLYTIWEQELPLVEEDGKLHFQGADVWFRKVSYPDPQAASEGDVDGDGDTDWDDGTLIQKSIGTTAYDPDFLWAGDYVPDNRITGHDYSRWKVQFAKEMLKKQFVQFESD